MYLISHCIYFCRLPVKKKKSSSNCVLKQQKVSIISTVQSPEVWNQGISSIWDSFWDPEVSVLCPPASLLLVTSGILDSWTYYPISASNSQRAFYLLCVFCHGFQTAIIGRRAHLTPLWPHLYALHSQMLCFQNEVTSWGSIWIWCEEAWFNPVQAHHIHDILP